MNNNKQKEDNVVAMPQDLEAIKTILEGAEIDYEEDVREFNNTLLSISVHGDKVINIWFGSKQELAEIEVV